MPKHSTPPRLEDLMEVALESSGGPVENEPTQPKLKLVESPTAEPVIREGEIHHIPLEQIIALPQFRTTFKGIPELGADIKHRGVIQPITVRWNNKHERFVVVVGERRFRAAQHIEEKTVPAIIRTLSDTDAAELCLAENLNREDLNPMDQARAFDTVRILTGYTAKEIAKRHGLATSTVTRSLSLLTLPKDMQEQIAEGKLAPGSARYIARIGDEKTQRLVLANVLSKTLSPRETEILVQEVIGKKKHPTSKGKARTKKKGPAVVPFSFNEENLKGRVNFVLTGDERPSYDLVVELAKAALTEAKQRRKAGITII